jgi:Na+/H+-dicarboxylate symporter
MKKEFLISLLVALPLGAFLSYVNYDSGNNDLTKSIVFGFLGTIGMFFVPYFIRKFKSNQK